MTECSNCDTEVQEVSDTLICPECGEVFECSHGESWCTGPFSDDLPCIRCFIDAQGGDGSTFREWVDV